MKKKRADDAERALAAYEKSRLETEMRTARLRQLRLAKTLAAAR